MATTIKLKNGTGVPSSGSLVVGEPALDLTNKRLYTEDSGGTVIEVGTNPGEDVTFADNRKAIFGAGSDLEIYHDGSNSYIDDAGTGSLFVRGSDLYLQDASGFTYLRAVDNGTGGIVTLYNDGLAKLATTTTGIDVTGTVTADGLTVDGSGTITNTASTTTLTLAGNTGSVAGLRLQAEEVHADIFGINEGVNYGGLKIQTNSNGTLKDRLKIESNGDISFYEDTGTTAKFFWDSSAESLGIGSSPNATLTVRGPVDTATLSTSSTPAARINNGGAISNWIGANGYNYGYIQSIQDDGTNNLKPLALQPLGGNVGIGTSSPSATLALDKNTTTQHRVLDLENNSITYSMYVDQDNSSTNSWSLFDTTNSQTALRYLPSSSGYWQFYTNNTEAMRINASGSLLVGKTSASYTIAGAQVEANGVIGATVNNNQPMFANRLSSDGPLFGFYKDGTAVGSIGTVSGLLGIGSGDAILAFDGTGNAMYPMSSQTGGASDGVLDFGSSLRRFKDLYLSGKVASATNNFYQLNDGSFGTIIQSAGGIKFNTAGGNERARIDSSGNLLVGCTGISTDAPNVDGSLLTGGGNVKIRKGTSGFQWMQFYGTGVSSPIGSISNVSNTGTSYNTTSDERLKENIDDANDAGAIVDAIQIRKFDWKVNGQHQRYGVIAQELNTVAPEAVSAPEDPEEMMGVDYSKLVPMLVKEIQSLRARVAQLETN